ncbi:hypothetical protein H2O64_09075 [Kordia sp. YSTF-M3]|uniref:Uncharacterized protein n=1 Tax=Kordia aestuariivivens TaxID=2759037 RepID=A0ABR7Q8Y3_9FLAO|nr:hypothetical protein [Kordia aestuariivivens]MBC8754821.1 hypothetical protein [Kordia aestuariivivens]
MTTQQQLNKELVQELKQLKQELAKYKRNFEIEMNIKNYLYFFILTNDLLDLLKEFKQKYNNDNGDYYIKSLEFLVNTST